jgi:hypothetical protein
VPCDDSQFSLQPPADYTPAYQKKLEEIPAKGNTSPTARKIDQSLNLWTEGNKDQAVEILLGVDWTLPVTFDTRPYIFTITEQDCITLKPEDHDKVFKETSASYTSIKEIAKYLIAQGQQAAASGNYDKAEKCYSTVNHLGQLLAKDPDLMIITRLVGIAVQKLTLNESIKLYPQTNNQ